MSFAAFRQFGRDLHSELASRAYMAALNYVLTGVFSREKMARQLVATAAAGIPEAEALQVINRAFDMALRPRKERRRA